MTYLAAFSVGPVQDFIAAARRCRDLWYGSTLLSEVSKAVARYLEAQGATLIFPPSTSDALTVGNKLLVSIDTDDIGGVAERAKIAAQEQLDKASKIKHKPPGLELDEVRYQAQLKHIIEFYSAWTPLTGDYRDARRRVDALLAGRKALRDFEKHDGAPGVWKSSLDGAREHVIQARPKDIWSSRLKENEYLDAIAVVKRFGGDKKSFDSTVDVAARPFVKGRGDKRMARYYDFLQDKKIDEGTYSLLYEHESRQIFDIVRQQAEYQELEAIREDLGKPKPPYYAMLMGDGDNMGDEISKITSAGGHQEFSTRLSTFALKAQQLIGDYDGCPIYCGGDDVLALLPLHTALECAQVVNQRFRELLKLRFSAGLVVVHGLEPLNDVRDWAKKAERKAKETRDKDTLCIGVYPRSGPDVLDHGEWDTFPDLIQTIVSLYVEKKLPFGLAHEFQSLLDRTADSAGSGWTGLNDAIPKMAKSIAKKKQSEAARELVDAYAKDRQGLDQLCRALLLARPFARAKTEAAAG